MIRSLLLAILAVLLAAGALAAESPNLLYPDMVKNMALIPAGVFTRGCDSFGPDHGAPAHQVHLNAFFIDIHEVTNGEFEKVMPEHVLRRSPFSDCDDCPVSKVTWYEAVDFCYLTGKSLPTEAQWEKAAGAESGCEFPWGAAFDRDQPQARGGLKLRDKASPVASYPPNKYGIHDMAGNMWEWVMDWFQPYPETFEILRNPLGPASGVMKLRRGGSWSDSVKSMAAGYRDWSYPYSRSFNDIGFRCVINLVDRP